MFASVRRWLPLALIALLALALRTHDLGRRVMHADEANQAVKLGLLLDQGAYAFDPRDHHGPTLYYFAVAPAWLRGETSSAALTETTVRLTPALFGVAVVLLTAALAAPLGRWPALVAAALVAVAPPAVYYSRYFIQETLLVAFTLGALVCAQRWWRRPRMGWALAAGACVGLMLATKTSALLYGGAAVVALLVAVRRTGGATTATAAWPGRSVAGRALAAAAGAALAAAALFYTSFGTYPAGLRDMFATYAPMLARATAGASGHEHAWSYYLELFLPRRSGGYLFDQTLFTVLALAGVGVAAAGVARPGGRLLRFVAVYAAIVGVVISLTPYKTPWNIASLVPVLAILAAGALAALADRGRAGGVAALGLGAAALGWQAWQTDRTSFRLPSDQRNPFAYVHSSPDVRRVRALAETALRRTPAGAIKIVSDEYWPLPWYLRDRANVGYWPEPPADCDGALVIAGAAQADAVRARLRGDYAETFLGLRPGVLVFVFTPR